MRIMNIKPCRLLGVLLFSILPLEGADTSKPSETLPPFKIRVYPLSQSTLQILLRPEQRPAITTTNAGSEIWGVKDEELRDFFIKSGIPFPPGASVTYNQRLSALAIVNTPENLKLVDRVVGALCCESPPQVTVEVRFLQLPRTLAEDLFADDEGLSKACIIKEKVLKRITQLGRQGKITELAQPKLTTVSGNTAQVKSVKEFRYPTEFNVLGSGSITNKPSTAGGAYTAVVPYEPGAFETREVGYLLNVTPTIGLDDTTINLTLVPEISSVAPKMRQYTVSVPTGKVTVEQPEFGSYQTTTTVLLKSGQTMLLAVMDPVAEDGKLTQNNVVFVLLSATIVEDGSK